MSKSIQIPEGMIADSRGRLVPREAVKPLDLIRDDLVRQMIVRVEEMRATVQEFRSKLFSEVESFIDLAASEYDVQMGGRKGNVSLTSYDGRMKVLIAVSERIVFDERIQVAKELIDQCIHEWAEGSRMEIKVLVDHAFQVDAEGKISIGRVLGLTRVAIDDPKWKRAVEAIRDSMKVTDTCNYIRFYKRESVEDKFQLISVDLSS